MTHVQRVGYTADQRCNEIEIGVARRSIGFIHRMRPVSVELVLFIDRPIGRPATTPLDPRAVSTHLPRGLTPNSRSSDIAAQRPIGYRR
jgi:hypothetical protein